MRITVLIASLAALAGPVLAANDLSGRVVTDDGKPLQGARVMLYTSPCAAARVRCAQAAGRKSATTSADGAFSLRSLDPQLVFRVLVVAEGFKPTFVERVHPAAGPVEAKVAG